MLQYEQCCWKTEMIVDQALNLLDLRSDYALAKKLGITRQAVSLWREKQAIPAGRIREIKDLAFKNIEELSNAVNR